MTIPSLQKLAYKLANQTEHQARQAELNADVKNTMFWQKKLNLPMIDTIRICKVPLSITRFKHMKHS